jgi:hypothetical protein
MGRAAMVLLLLGLAGATWYAWPYLAARFGAISRTAPAFAEVPSETLASQAEEKLLRIGAGTSREVILSGVEIESLLLYRFEDRWPRGVSAPSVHLRDGELRLGFQLSRDMLPALPDLDGLFAFLPDTVPVQLWGRVLALGSGEVALMVHRFDASSIPVPRRLFPIFLSQLQGVQSPGVPPEALVLPLPEGIRAVRIEGSSLVITPAS